MTKCGDQAMPDHITAGATTRQGPLDSQCLGSDELLPRHGHANERDQVNQDAQHEMTYRLFEPRIPRYGAGECRRGVEVMAVKAAIPKGGKSVPQAGQDSNDT